MFCVLFCCFSVVLPRLSISCGAFETRASHCKEARGSPRVRQERPAVLVVAASGKPGLKGTKGNIGREIKAEEKKRIGSLMERATFPKEDGADLPASLRRWSSVKNTESKHAGCPPV